MQERGGDERCARGGAAAVVTRPTTCTCGGVGGGNCHGSGNAAAEAGAGAGVDAAARVSKEDAVERRGGGGASAGRGRGAGQAAVVGGVKGGSCCGGSAVCTGRAGVDFEGRALCHKGEGGEPVEGGEVGVLLVAGHHACGGWRVGEAARREKACAVCAHCDE